MIVLLKILNSKWLYIAIGVVLVMLLLRGCNEDPQIITEIEYVDRVETITKVEIQEVPKKVYVYKTQTLKGKDSVIYVKEKDTNNLPIIEANQFTTLLKSNNATADLKITTTGTLLDVKGVINYKEKITTITEFKNNSGLFLYGQTNTKFDTYGIGLDYVIKNKVIIGVNGNYNTQFDNASLNFKVGYRIF